VLPRIYELKGKEKRKREESSPGVGKSDLVFWGRAVRTFKENQPR
jgi:hypothetical protein